MRRVVFDFLAELIDKDPQIFALIAVLRTPYRSEQTIVRNRPPRMEHQITQHLKFFRAQVDLLPQLLHPIPARIQQDGPNCVFAELR